jgi:hypothetical protein
VSGPKKMRPVAWRVWCGEICIYTYDYIWYIYNIHISTDSSKYALLYAFRYPLKTHEHTLIYIYWLMYINVHTHTKIHWYILKSLIYININGYTLIHVNIH